jgi:putative SOS response-associated peptidase YedK
MCGRYTLTDPTDLKRRFDLADSSETRMRPRYNVAPGQGVPMVVQSARGRELRAAAWGFRPIWVWEDPTRPPPVTARAETVAVSGLFHQSLERRRCLVPADGYYEWRAVSGHDRRLPVRFTLRGGGLFAFAGIFTGPRDVQAEDASCALLTTRANALVAPVRTRMPVILRPEDEALWLDPKVRDPDAALTCCRPYPAELMRCYDVGPAVGDPLLDAPELVVRLDEPLSAHEQAAAQAIDERVADRT